MDFERWVKLGRVPRARGEMVGDGRVKLAWKFKDLGRCERRRGLARRRTTRTATC